MRHLISKQTYCINPLAHRSQRRMLSTGLLLLSVVTSFISELSALLSSHFTNKHDDNVDAHARHYD